MHSEISNRMNTARNRGWPAGAHFNRGFRETLEDKAVPIIAIDPIIALSVRWSFNRWWQKNDPWWNRNNVKLKHSDGVTITCSIPSISLARFVIKIMLIFVIGRVEFSRKQIVRCRGERGKTIYRGKMGWRKKNYIFQSLLARTVR